jgi:hypothetical protein
MLWSMLCYTTLHPILHYTTLCYTIHPTFALAMSCRIYAMLCYAMLYLCYAISMLCYAISMLYLCYAISMLYLCYAISMLCYPLLHYTPYLRPGHELPHLCYAMLYLCYIYAMLYLCYIYAMLYLCYAIPSYTIHPTFARAMSCRISVRLSSPAVACVPPLLLEAAPTWCVCVGLCACRFVGLFVCRGGFVGVGL